MVSVTAKPINRLPGPKPRRADMDMARGGPVTQQPGNSCQSFEEIGSLGALGQPAGPHRLRLAPGIGGVAQLPLFEEANLPAPIIREHHDATGAPAIHIYGIPGHELGGGGLLQRDGQVFSQADVVPGYFNTYLRAGGETMPEIWQRGLFKPDADIYAFDAPVALAIHPNVVYGHFLLEMLPRLHLLSWLRRAGLPFLTALHYHIPSWAKQIIGHYFAPDEIIWYDAATTRIRSPCFILPSMMQIDGRFHPAFNMAVDEIADFLRGSVPPSADRKIWLSRARHPGASHGLTNQDQIEAMVARLGYRIIHPQNLSLAEQIAVMEGAEIIACAYSSATHNSIFARRGTKLFCVNRLNRYQSGVGRLRSLPTAYHLLDPARFHAGPLPGVASGWYDVDPAALRDALLRFETWQPSHDTAV